MTISYTPIGIARSLYQTADKMPIQPTGALGSKGRIEIYPEFADGLKDLEGFSHIYLIYHFHRALKKELIVTPFLDTSPRGIFATRAPVRPNPIGLSVVKLLSIDKQTLDVENIDVLDQTPVLDIKPYVPEFDHFNADRIGWLEKTAMNATDKKSDDRFK